VAFLTIRSIFLYGGAAAITSHASYHSEGWERGEGRRQDYHRAKWCRMLSRKIARVARREREREREGGGAILDARIVRARRRRESRFHEKRKGRERVLARMRDVRDEAGPREMRSAAAGFL